MLINRITNFRRIQMALALWGIIIIAGGLLHDALLPRLGIGAVLGLWVGLTFIGLVGMYVIAPETLVSGTLLIWTIICLLPLAATGLIIFPLNGKGSELIAPIWHGLFFIGYALTARIMDKRLWFLAAWELILTVLMLCIEYKILPFPDLDDFYGLVFGLSSGIPLLLAALPIWKETYSKA